jgi:hypothetical protein
MKQHDIPSPGVPPRKRRIAGRAQDDHVIDTYKLRKKLSDPTRCPRCGATYHEGRWQWARGPLPPTAHEEVCTACRRIKDEYPAGVVTLRHPDLARLKAEIVALARNLEASEKDEHPLNRIMAIEERARDELVITTTDIHLPRRIGEAVQRAFHGDLQLHYDQENYFVRVDWQRDA